MQAQFSQKITGERKAVMAVVAGITQTAVVYTKAPRFAYEAGGRSPSGRYSIDREGLLTSPVFPIREAAFHANVMGALGKEGFAAEGTLSVTIFPEEYDPCLLGNVQAVLAGKATLIRHALRTDLPLSPQLAEGGFLFPCFPATLRGPAILAAIQFSERVHALAASRTRVRAKDAPVENEKYAMRCFLLRLGMIGPEYAVARKELVSRLSGNSSFKRGPRPVAAPEGGEPARNCTFCAYAVTKPREEGGAFGRWFCERRREYVRESDVCEEFRG